MSKKCLLLGSSVAVDFFLFELHIEHFDVMTDT